MILNRLAITKQKKKATKPKSVTNNLKSLLFEEEEEKEEGDYSINKVTAIETINNNKNEDISCSLSNLASQYLSAKLTTATKQSIQKDKKTSKNLANLIDDEFNKEINEIDVAASTSSFKQQINLNNDLLLVKKDSAKKESNPIHQSNESHLQFNVNDKHFAIIFEIFNPKNSFTFEADDLLSFQNESLIGNLLAINLNNNNVNDNEPINQKFTFLEQKSQLTKENASSKVFRKRIVIDQTNNRSSPPLSSSTSASPNNTNVIGDKNELKRDNNEDNNINSKKLKNKKEQSKIKPKTKCSHYNHHHQQQQQEFIKIFDFSIPSPDDIVIAKQKFAFKNAQKYNNNSKKSKENDNKTELEEEN
jgi:hypothetical protein